jgi:hypothetical protein
MSSKTPVHFAQSAGVQVVRKPVKCSTCSELRTQDARCENCGATTPYLVEKEKDENKIPPKRPGQV